MEGEFSCFGGKEEFLVVVGGEIPPEAACARSCVRLGGASPG